MFIEFYVITEDCLKIAQQLEAVLAQRLVISNWATSESLTASQAVMSAYSNNELDAVAALRVTYLADVTTHLYAAGIQALKSHFEEAAARVVSMEEAICRRGERLFDL